MRVGRVAAWIIGFALAGVQAGYAGEAVGGIPPDRAGFTVTVARRLNAAGLPRPVTIARPLRLVSHAADGITFVALDLDDAYRGCVAMAARCAELVQHLIAGANDITRAPYVAVTPVALRVAMRPDSFVVNNARYWQLVTEVSTQDAPIGLAAILFADEAHAMRTIGARDLAVMHLDTASAYAVALRNMAVELQPIDRVVRRLAPRRVQVLSESPYESSRLLMHGDWAELSAAWKGHLLVAAPAADRVLFTDGADPDAVDAIVAEAKADYKTAERAISPDVFEWHHGGWGVIRP